MYDHLGSILLTFFVLSFMAYFWVLYLIRLVVQDDKVREYGREMARRREEKRRRMMDEQDAKAKKGGDKGYTDKSGQPLSAEDLDAQMMAEVNPMQMAAMAAGTST